MPRDRQTLGTCFLLFGLPLAIRLFFCVLWSNAFTWGDGLFYAAIAEQFFAHGWLQDYLLLFPPGYPAAVIAARLLFPLDAALVFVSLAAGAVVPALVWWIVRQNGETRTAWYAWALTSCSPLLIGLSMERLADSLFIALLVAALGSLIRFLSGAKLRWLLFFSIFSALAVQTKPEALILVALQTVLLLVLKRFRLSRRFLYLGVVWGIVLVIGSPYWIWLHHKTGNWMISGKAPLNLMHARAKAVTDSHSEELRFVYREAFSLDESGQLAFLHRDAGFSNYLLEEPIRAAGVYWKNVIAGIRILSPAALPLILAAFAGSVLLLQRRQRLLWLFLMAPVILLVFPPFFVTLAQPSFHPGRLAGPVVPSLIIVAAYGLDGLTQSRRRLSLWIVAAWCVAALSLAYQQTTTLDQANRSERRLIDLHRESVSSWLENETPSEAIIVSTSLLDDAYGGRRSVWFPWGESTRLFEYLHRRRVDYVLQDTHGGIFTPGFEAVDVDPRMHGFQPVNSLDTVPPVVIYQSTESTVPTEGIE